MEKNDRNRCIALAALFQTASLVRELAYIGTADDQDSKVLLQSLFNNEVESVDEIYGGLKGLSTGFTLVSGLLNNPGSTPEAVDITRYTIGLMHLQKKLDMQSDIGKQLLQGIDEVQRQQDYFDDLLNEAVLAGLAKVYQETVSMLGPKIKIQGEQVHLENETIAARIRALLLSGIRAAVLWQQAGGGRFTLLFQRGKIANQARAILNET